MDASTCLNTDSFGSDILVAVFYDNSSEKKEKIKPIFVQSRNLALEDFLHRKFMIVKADADSITSQKGCMFVTNDDQFTDANLSGQLVNSNVGVKMDTISMTKVRTAFCCTIPPPASPSSVSTNDFQSELHLTFLCSIPGSNRDISSCLEKESSKIEKEESARVVVPTKSLLDYPTFYETDTLRNYMSSYQCTET